MQALGTEGVGIRSPNAWGGPCMRDLKEAHGKFREALPGINNDAGWKLFVSIRQQSFVVVHRL